MGSRSRLVCLALAAVAGVVFVVARASAPDGDTAARARVAASGRAALIAAREEQPALPAPKASLETPAGTLRIVEPELVAATFGQPVRFELAVDDAAAEGTLEVGIPARWSTRAVSGLVPSKAPRAIRSAKGVAFRARAGAAALRVSGAQAGERMRFEVVDTGIPASTYKLPVTWSDASGTRKLGTLEARFYAPSREQGESTRLNVTNDFFFESETFVTAVPNDTSRVLVGSNGGSTDFNGWVSTTGGSTFTEKPVPSTMDVPASAANPIGNLCCDPFSMADDAGNIWYGGLAFDDTSGGPSRITVSRIPSGSSSFVNTVGLPERTGAGIQDKPMGAIDLDATSAHYGMLYVVWDEPDFAGVNVVISMCDTRPGVTSTLDAARCDNADNWTAPATIAASGSYIYPEVAAGPDGKVYVIWWDYSATNAIRGATCAAVSNCALAASWSAASTIATLDATGGAPVPFACPIPAQPGGRVGPATAMDIDHTLSPSRGTVYVTWSDLQPGSGATRCDDDGFSPLPTNMTWDSFVATASNALPGGVVPSASAGAKIMGTGEAGWPANSDEWFPSVAVDQSTGQAWVDVYSTLEDPTRAKMHVYARPVTSTEALGSLSKVSTFASDYSTNLPCCSFDNDYGDYNGIDAAGGKVFTVWSDKSSTDGEAFLEVFNASSPPAGPPGPSAPPPPPPPPPANLLPIAHLAAPSLATAGPVTFNAGGSSDPDGAIVKYQWDADGNASTGFEVDTGTVPTLTRTLAAGNRTVVVLVTDNRGGTATASRLVAVRPVARVRMLGNGARIKVRKGRFSVKLSGCSRCTGKATAKSKRTTVGSARYTLKATGGATVTIKVSKAAMRLLKKAKANGIPVTLTITVSNGAGSSARATGKIRLRL